jgi:hypothetical protein
LIDPFFHGQDIGQQIIKPNHKHTANTAENYGKMEKQR